MARQYAPDPWQEDYERQKAAGFPKQPAPRPATTDPWQQDYERRKAAEFEKQPAAQSGFTIPPPKLILGGLIVLAVIIAAIIGHSIAASNSIAAGDCVVTNPNVLTGWDIKKVDCSSNPGTALTLQKVTSVQDGSDGECGLGLTTFHDDPASKTYCLTDIFGAGG